MSQVQHRALMADGDSHHYHPSELYLFLFLSFVALSGAFRTIKVEVVTLVALCP